MAEAPATVRGRYTCWGSILRVVAGLLGLANGFSVLASETMRRLGRVAHTIDFAEMGRSVLRPYCARISRGGRLANGLRF